LENQSAEGLRRMPPMKRNFSFYHSVILSLSKDQFRLPFFHPAELILRQAQDDRFFRDDLMMAS